MISGQMYFFREPKKSVAEIVQFLMDLHKPENVKYVLVHPAMIQEEISQKGIKIKPKRGILPNHFWFISDNNPEKRPESRNFVKIT